MATYTYNGKRSFAREFSDSLSAFYRKRWLATLYFSVFSIALFFVGFALFVRFKAGFADHI